MSSSINHDTVRGNKDIQARQGERETRKANLKVAEAEQRDVGRKIARVDPEVAERLNIASGDALELSSLGRKTTVLSWPAKESDRGKGLIRIDGLYRNRLDVGINDLIEIKESRIKRCQKYNICSY